MEVIEQSAEGLAREFKVKVDAAELDRRLTAKLEEMKGQVSLKGFRPGKAPVSFLKKRFGKDVMGDIVQEVLGETTEKALGERDLKPATQPKIDFANDLENIAKGGVDLEYTMSVEVLPEVTPADLSGLKLSRMTADVADETVTERLEMIAEQQTSYEARKDSEKAEDGDALTIDFVGRIDGEEFDGGKGEDSRLVLGSNTFIPGFEDQLVGAKTGDEVTVKVTFPEDYGVEHLTGKDAEFSVEVKEVAAPVKQEINDELATRVGLADLDALKKAVTESIENEYKQMSRTHVKRALLDELDKLHSFDLPPSMVEQEFTQIWSQVEQAGLDDEDKEKPEEEVKAEYRKIAERRVRLGLVLAEIGTKNNVTVPQEEITRAVSEQARQFPGQEQQVFEFYQKNPEALAQIRAPLFEDRVIDFILELADVTDEKVTPEKLAEDPGDDFE